MPSAACEHALTISTSGRTFLHSWDSIWGLEQCNSTRCLTGTGTSAKPYRYSSHLFPRAEKRAVCSAIRGHFLQVYSWWVRTYFGPFEYWQVLRAKFFLIQKTWEISNKETHEEILQFNKQKNTKIFLTLWLDCSVMWSKLQRMC